MRANVLKTLLCNEKIAGDLLLQKEYINNPIDKKRVINKGEKPQYFVQNSHEAILDRDTYNRVLEEYERRGEKYRPFESRGPRKSYPFTAMITCGHCGAHFRRKTVHSDKCRVVWICETYNTKGKAHCNAKQIPEAILHDAAARALGLSNFDEDVFNKMVVSIKTPENGVIIFSLQDGHEITIEWQNKSRRDSWTPEMREQARAAKLKSLRKTGEMIQ